MEKNNTSGSLLERIHDEGMAIASQESMDTLAAYPRNPSIAAPPETIYLNYSSNEIGFSIHYKIGDKDTWHLFDLFKDADLETREEIKKHLKERLTQSGRFVIGNETKINVMQED